MKTSIFFSLALTMWISQGICQPLIVQISAGADSASSPSITVSDDGKIWMAYLSGSSSLDAGYFANNTWNPTISATLPGDLKRDIPVVTTVDEMNRVWLVYGSLSTTVETGFFSSGGVWTHVLSLGPRPSAFYGIPYGVTRNHLGGVWVFNTENSSYPKVVHAWYAVGNNVLSQRDLLFDFGWPTGNLTYNFLRGAVSLPSDSIVVAFQHKGETSGGNNTSVSTLSNVRFSQEGTIVRVDSAYIREPRDNGWTTDVAGLGSNHSEIFLLTRRVYRAWPIGVLTFYYYYDCYLFSGTTIAREWNNIIPRLDNPSVYFKQPNGVSVSQASRQLAIAWVSGDTLLVRILDSLTWFKTSPCIDTVSDGLRTEQQVRVTSDSMAYLTYSAMNNGRQHVFLARFRPNYIVDTLLTAVSEREERIPREITLRQNYPNPFNPLTTIEYDVPQMGFVSLDVYNTLGEKVTSLVSEVKEAGHHRTTLDGSGLSSGVYFYRLRSAGGSITMKAILLR